MAHAIILLAGNSTRYKSDTPKQLETIKGKPLFMYSYEVFDKSPLIESIVLVCQPKQMPVIAAYIKDKKRKTVTKLVAGGSSRRESVKCGLDAFDRIKDDEIVIIHDSARPLVKEEMISLLVENLQNNCAATIAAQCRDTVIDDEKFPYSYLNRDNIFMIQTPQGFHFKTIMSAHLQNQDLKVTDDTRLVQEIGEKVQIVPWSKPNFKVTTVDDMSLFKAMSE